MVIVLVVWWWFKKLTVRPRVRTALGYRSNYGWKDGRLASREGQYSSAPVKPELRPALASKAPPALQSGNALQQSKKQHECGTTRHAVITFSDSADVTKTLENSRNKRILGPRFPPWRPGILATGGPVPPPETWEQVKARNLQVISCSYFYSW